MDTKNKFPHLANCAKYILTIMYYVTLSLYRIDGTDQALGLFITFASVNAAYCCKDSQAQAILLASILANMARLVGSFHGFLPHAT